MDNPDFTQAVKPLIPGVGQIEAAGTIFFYQRKDGTVIMVQESEAWTLHKKGNQVVGQITLPLLQVGVSDGLLFQKATQESHQIFKTEGLEAAQARVRQGFEEELALARGFRQTPRNFDITDSQRQPIDMASGELIRPNKRVAV